MNLRFYIIIIVIFCSLALRAQVPYTDYINPFPQTYLGFGNAVENDAVYDNSNFYMGGGILLNPQKQSLIFKKNATNNSTFKVYYADPQTTMCSMAFNSNLNHYYAFISTDGTVGCGSAGLKALKIDKTNLAIVDSAFFCDPIKPSAGPGFFIHNHFYVTSRFAQGFPAPLPPNYSKNRNLIRKIDTNLVMLNEQLIGDTSVTFGTYFLREAIDTGIIMNTLNETEYCPMLIKLDTMGIEQWRKRYYTTPQTGCGTSSPNGIVGLQNYKNGYIALFNASNTGGCSSYFYTQSIVAKLDKNGDLVKEVQYTVAGDTTLEFYSNLTNYTKRTKFYNILIKTNDGHFASVISEREKYGFNQHENYMVVLDTNLNIIHRSPPLGSLSGFLYPGMAQGIDSTFYLGGGVMNATNDGMNVRVYTYKIGGQVGLMEYKNEQLFKIYPNPAVDELNIELDEEPQFISIHNSLGQLVYSQTHDGSIKINVSNWSKGVYFVELRNTKTSAKQSQKIIVE
jgi:hypothetical protein